MKNPACFIASQTIIETAPLVPELRLYLATEITPIWQATETHLAELNIEPPFWAFAWPGSQLLARWILDHPETVRGKRVLDFACGGGLAGLACAQAGASEVLINDIDQLALEAAQLNASLNDLTLVPIEATGSARNRTSICCFVAMSVTISRWQTALFHGYANAQRKWKSGWPIPVAPMLPKRVLRSLPAQHCRPPWNWKARLQEKPVSIGSCLCDGEYLSHQEVISQRTSLCFLNSLLHDAATRHYPSGPLSRPPS
ncbi:class I SAM-dependent methyltransferase [Asaia prunellae]|uniref:class I SAM-dependent methyltransferase n=1 Tax=Asaia prunellae TaxID=610245 RepID=UPI000A81F62E